MARIQVNIRFVYDGVLYADTFGYIPRHEAIKIPELKVEENQSKAEMTKHLSIPLKQISGKQKKGNREEQMDEEIGDQNQNQNQDMMEMEIQDPENENFIENEEPEQQGEIEDIDEQDEQRQMEELQILQKQYQNDEGEDQDDEIDDDNDLSEISRSIQPNVTYAKYQTKRQKRLQDNFLELPIKKPRKDAKKFDEATQLIRKQQKQRKRRQYIKKLMQAQEKATFDKILNETGRKFRQRQEKQMKQVKQKDHKNYRTLGDVPKIITREKMGEGTKIQLHRTELFPIQRLTQPNVRMTEACSICNRAIGKYKTGGNQRFCSVDCFRQIKQKQNCLKANI